MRAAVAPGKVILTGEHAVVHGGAALSMAINRHIHALYSNDDSNTLRWRDPVSGSCQQVTQTQLVQCVDRLELRFDSWQQGQLPIQSILENPSDLLMYSLAQAIQGGAFPGGDLRWRSNLPIGAGMGSSAAFIAVMLKLFSQDSADSLAYLHQVHFCERLQHGKGSLIDAASVTLGGTVRVQQEAVSTIHAECLYDDFYWIFTGTPDASTGECVEWVKKSFTGSSIWDAFAEIEAQWLEVSTSERGDLIRQNHQLLCQIGVVPDVIQQLIGYIELLGGAAKISGAGSIRGDTGGLLIAWLPCLTPDQLSLPKGAYWGALQQESSGVQAFSI